jgi:LacI family transcriptional regulator
MMSTITFVEDWGLPVSAERARGRRETTASQRVTVSDVAREAGVSTATVTRALQGSAAVVPATKQRVEEVARRLGYSPNPMARDLRHGSRVRAVGLVTAGFTNAFQAAVAAGAEQELRSSGLELLIASTDDDPEREPELARAMVDRRVSALLMMPDGHAREFLRPESTYRTPVVMVGRPAGELDVDVVMTDDDVAVEEATAHLWSLGHRRIAALAGRSDSFRTRQRLEGYRRALARCGGEPDETLVVTGLESAAAARQAMQELMRGDEVPTAVLALNLGISTGVLLDRIENHRETAFIALDESELSAGLGISAIVRDPRALGREAARLAVARIESPDAARRTVLLPSKLVQRGSGEIPATRVRR